MISTIVLTVGVVTTEALQLFHFLSKVHAFFNILFLLFYFKVHELEESNQQVALLIEKLNQLQTENASLRDQNDELTVEIESTNRRYHSALSMKQFFP